MTIKKTNPDFLNGVPELLVLQLLDRRPMHGYDLVQAIRAASGKKLDFGEGCIYPVLHRLEKQKFLASKRELVGGRNRIIYRLTKQGNKRLAESVASWKNIVAAVSTVLQGSEHGKPAMDYLATLDEPRKGHCHVKPRHDRRYCTRTPKLFSAASCPFLAASLSGLSARYSRK